MANGFQAKLTALLEADSRYAAAAYEFLYAALEHTVHRLGLHDQPERAGRHVSGRQLCDGIRDLALKRFGFLARAVFHQWGVHRTADWGTMVFNLVEAELMSKTDQDDAADFADVFDFALGLEEAYFAERRYAPEDS